MRISVFLILNGLFLLFTQQGIAQKEKDSLSEITCTLLGVPAEYPGGMVNFNNEFRSRFVFPEEALGEAVFRLVLQFNVQEDGRVTDIKLIRDPGLGIGAEAQRVLSIMSRWKPAIYNNRISISSFTLPFTLAKSEDVDFIVDAAAYQGVKAFYAQAYYEAGLPQFKEDFKEVYDRSKQRLDLPEKVMLNLQFIVELDGSLSQVKVLNAPSDEVEIVVKEMLNTLGKWRPGKVNNTAVRSYYMLQLFLN